MKKIIVSVTNDLTTDQRVAKVCNSLFKNNYEVILVGRQLKDSKPLSRQYKTKRFKLLFNQGFLFYAEYNIRLFFFLLFSSKDILLANDLDTLLPNFLISKIQRKKLVFDSHELFSEVPELVKKPLRKKFWLQLEQLLIPKLKNCYTVCESIANYYNSKYSTNFKVVRNFPTKKDVIRKPLGIETNGKKVIIYQGALNLGRGLELMINTMAFLNNHLLLIVGDGDISDELKQLANTKNLNSRVQFLGKIAPKELHKLTPNAHLGISLEEDLGLNYRYALPNKVFDYIQANVPLLVSDLPEMSKIVTEYKVGEIVKDRIPEKLAVQIEKLLEKDFSNSLNLAKKQLIWKHEEKVLLNLFKQL